MSGCNEFCCIGYPRWVYGVAVQSLKHESESKVIAYCTQSILGLWRWSQEYPRMSGCCIGVLRIRKEISSTWEPKESLTWGVLEVTSPCGGVEPSANETWIGWLSWIGWRLRVRATVRSINSHLLHSRGTVLDWSQLRRYERCQGGEVCRGCLRKEWFLSWEEKVVKRKYHTRW